MTHPHILLAFVLTLIGLENLMKYLPCGMAMEVIINPLYYPDNNNLDWLSSFKSQQWLNILFLLKLSHFPCLFKLSEYNIHPLYCKLNGIRMNPFEFLWPYLIGSRCTYSMNYFDKYTLIIMLKKIISILKHSTFIKQQPQFTITVYPIIQYEQYKAALSGAWC